MSIRERLKGLESLVDENHHIMQGQDLILRSQIIVPIVVPSGPIGALIVATPHWTIFRDVEIELAEEMADSISMRF